MKSHFSFECKCKGCNGSYQLDREGELKAAVDLAHINKKIQTMTRRKNLLTYGDLQKLLADIKRCPNYMSRILSIGQCFKVFWESPLKAK